MIKLFKTIIVGMLIVGSFTSIQAKAKSNGEKYTCVPYETININTSDTVKMTESQMKNGVFGFVFYRDSLYIVDNSGDRWNYLVTKGGVDYYTSKSDKNLAFIIGKTEGKKLYSGILLENTNQIIKSLCIRKN